MKSDERISFLKTWEGFLPPNTVVMARRSASVAAATAHYRIAFEAPGIDQPAARDLFLKIAAALGVSETEYFVSPEPLAAALSAAVSAETRIRFTADAATDSSSLGWQDTTLTTYSLAAMLEKPDLKKLVWAVLRRKS